ncbi:PREDICTED: uncharacterized protein LOC104748652 [Camelina sativa]|uniref:Uncharacterized protein LOC104748652 n=1 Tax=Camelina sativa TaxID=90675 RepID=A0ABM0WBE3_CAMSA|nr:PREDICTED: uncharacterized protein LOC104748652 [Camelina sativa]
MSDSMVSPQETSSAMRKESWVSMVQNKKVLRKFDVTINSSERSDSVDIPDEVLDNSTPLWDDFLLGKFLDTAPHVGKVHVILKKIWKQGTEFPKIDVYEVNATTLRFKVSDPILRSRILKCGMWNIAEVSMVISRWSLVTEKEQPEEKSIPLWVHLKKVPLHLFSWEGLSFIASAVGSPVRLHPETVACSNIDVAKVFVNADLSKVPPKSISYSNNGKSFSVDFHYPWLPPRCSSCEKWGHLVARCGVDKSVVMTPPIEVTDQNSVLSSAPVVGTVPLKDVLPLVPSVTVPEKSVTASVVEEGVHSLVDKSVALEEWSVVSPSKMSRSPSKSSAQQSTMPTISASKFAVLSVSEDEEEGEISDEAASDVDGKPLTLDHETKVGVSSEDVSKPHV